MSGGIRSACCCDDGLGNCQDCDSCDTDLMFQLLGEVVQAAANYTGGDCDPCFYDDEDPLVTNLTSLMETALLAPINVTQITANGCFWEGERTWTEAVSLSAPNSCDGLVSISGGRTTAFIGCQGNDPYQWTFYLEARCDGTAFGLPFVNKILTTFIAQYTAPRVTDCPNGEYEIDLEFLEQCPWFSAEDCFWRQCFDLDFNGIRVT